MFNRLDADKNGTIEFDEIKVLLFKLLKKAAVNGERLIISA
jgi:hypothetical protein